MANGGKITYDIGFNVDKNSLGELKKQLEEIKKLTATDLMNKNPNITDMSQARKEILALRKSVTEIETAWKNAFDPTLGVTNINKLNQNLKQVDLTKVATNFRKLGSQGDEAFSKIALKAMTTNLRFKETNNILDKMGKTLINTLKWTFSSSLINRFTGAIQQAVGYVEHLDSSLNDIRIVTKKSADEMEVFGQRANDAAKALGKATTDYTEAALIYYQQGLSDEEVKARAETTLKAANVTGQATKTVSEQLTSVWNGFKVNAEQTEEYVDKLAAVAAISASNLEELSTGMSKVASAASNLGVDIDQLNAMLSTVISVTRQAPESVGTAYKTIFARISDLKLGEFDEDGLGLGDVSGGLKKLGINVLDAEGELRDLGTVIEEVAAKWDSWTSAQQAAIAQLMAGKRQYNNLVALFSNWDMYENAINTSRNATGELQKQQDIYMESTEAHLQQLKTQWEDVYDSIIDPDSIKDISDALTGVLSVVTKLIDAMGGGEGLLLGLSAVFTKVFNQQIATGLEGIITKFKNAKDNAKQVNAEIEVTKQIAQAAGASPDAVAKIANMKANIQQYYDVMSDAEKQLMNDYVEKAGQAEIQMDKAAAKAKDIENYIKRTAEHQHNMGSSTFRTDGPKSNLAAIRGMDILNNGEIPDAAKKAMDEAVQATDKVSESYQRVIDSIQEYKAALDQSSDGKATAEYREVRKALTEYNKAKDDLIKKVPLESEQQKQLADGYNKLNQSVKNLNISYKAQDKTNRGTAVSAINANLKSQDNLVNQITTDVHKQTDAYEQVTQAAIEEYQKAQAEGEKYKLVLEATQQFDTRKLVMGITNTAQGISQIGFSLQALQGLANTLFDDTLSSGEKILQLMMSMTMVLPGILKMWQGLNAVKAFGVTITQAQLAEEGETVLLEGASVGIVEAKSLAISVLTEKQAFYSGVLGESTVQEAINSGKIEENTIATILNTEAKQGNAQVTALMGQGVQTSTGLLGKMGSKLGRLTSQIGLSSAALGGLAIGAAAVIGTVVVMNKLIQSEINHMAELATQTEENAKKQTEAVEQEAESIEKLKEEFNSLSSQYEENSLTIGQFRDKVHDLAIQYGEEEIAIKSLTGSYEDLRNAILDLEDSASEEYIKSAKAEQEALENKLKNTIYRDLGSTEQDEIYDLQKGKYVQTLDLEGFYGESRYTDNELIKGLQDLGITYYGSGQIDMSDLANVLTYQYDDLEKLLNSSTEDGAKRLQEIINEHKEDIDRAKALIQGQEDANKKIRVNELKQNSENVKNQESATKVYQEYIKKAQEAGKTLQQANQEFSQQALELDNKYLHDIAEENNTVAAIRDIITNNREFTSGTTITDKIKDKIKSLQDLGLDAEDFSLLTDEEWKKFYTGDLTSEQIAQLLVERQKAALEQSRENFSESSLSDSSSGVKSSISNAIQGNLDTSSEEYSKLLDNLKELQRLYPELTNEVETFSDIGLVGTEHWIQAAYDLQSALDKIEFANLNKKVDEVKEKIKNLTTEKRGDNPHEEVIVEVVPETEDFIEAVDELLDADYAINVEVHSDAERDFTQLVDSMKQADDLASKIGEDFIVAADDIRELNNAFPGILQGIEYLGDGTIKLNEEIVQSAMNAAIQQEALSTEELVTKLNNDKTYLQNKRNIYDTMITILQDAAEKGMVTEQTVTDFDAQMDELKALNNQTVAQAEIDNDKTVAENSAANAEISADNWTKSYEYASQAAFTFAQNAIRNAQEVAKGPDGVPQSPSGFKSNFGFTWKGSGGASSEAKAAEGIKRVTKDTSVDQINSQIASLQNASEALGKEINDIDGMIAAAGAKLDESTLKNKDVGKKKDSGSGSKSGGKGKDPEQLEYIEREEDIYRAINEELDHIESALGRIDKINSHRWGASYKKNLEQQNKLLNQQLSKLKEKNKLQVDDLATRRKQLEKEGVIFSEDGSVLQNGEEILNKLYAEYNEMVNQYNEMSADRQESFKADMETKKNYIDALEKKMSEYESGYADMLSNVNEQLDTHYQIIENQVSHFNAEVEVKLELKNAEKDWNDFWKEIIEDVQDDDFSGQIAANIKQLKTLIGLGENNGESIGEVQLNHLKDNFVEIDKLLNHDYTGIFKDDVNAAKENLEQYRDQLMSTIKEVEGLVDDIGENYLNQLKSGQDLIDKQLEKLDAIDKHISHNIELIKLIDGEKAFDAIDAQYQNKYQNNLATIETQRASKEYWETQMAEQKALLDASEKGSKKWQTANKAYEEAVNGYIKATGDLDAAVEQALQDLKEQTENANAKILDTLDKAMSGGIGLDLVEEEWKLINDEANKYYDNVERYINMEEYTHQLNEAADAIGLSAENQQKLNEFREQELKQLNEKERLTSYDIEESRARLEILKQELALQDAQANKSKMRLRRDTQGNYNYQYVADESKVEEAENGLLTAKKEWYSIVKNRYQELSNDIIAIQKQQLEYAKQIKDAESAGDIERLNKYKELYNQNAEYLKWAMTEAEKNKRDMYNGTQLYFKQVDDTTLEQSKTTVRHLIDQWAGGGEQSFIGAVKKAITDLDAAQAAFQTKTDEVLSAAGTDYDNLVENNIDPTLDKLNSLTDKDLMEKLDHIAGTLKDQWDYLVEAEKAYTNYRATAVEELGKVIEKLKELAKWQDTTSKYKAPETPPAGDAPKLDYEKGTPNTSGNNDTSSNGDRGTDTKRDGGNPGTPPKKTGYTVTYTDSSGGHSYNQNFTTKDRAKLFAVGKLIHGSLRVTILDESTQKSIQGNYAQIKNTPSAGREIQAKNIFSSFRSGGYTGEWGNGGRLGILHQKELVLNENDTKNMLSAVQILRSIPYSVIAQSLINSSTNTASALSGINSGISGLAAAATNNESKTMVVNADFSGVHDADEIYQALLELENYGLQNSYSVAPHANSMY